MLIKETLYFYIHELVFQLLPPANEVWGKVIFSVACVKNSVRGGVCLSACWNTTPPGADTPLDQTPPEKTPPRADTPREQTPPRSRPPGSRRPPDRRLLLRSVRILLECILVFCNVIETLN